jgi:hypothetical protein
VAQKKSNALGAVLAVVVIAFACASCDKLFHREAPDASAPIASTSPSALDAAVPAEDEEEESAGTTDTDASDRDASLGLGLFGVNSGDGGACPRPIFPGYCRRRCQSFGSRKVSMHARRIGSPSRAGIGTCGGFNVFAEDATTGGGVVEYYNATTDALVGAIDSRQPGCNRYGDIPSCKPVIAWGPPRRFGGVK